LTADQVLMSVVSSKAELELRAFLEWIRFENAAAVTLTMKKRAGAKVADDINASDNFRHFRNRLDHAALGSRAKRYGTRLKMVAVLERSASPALPLQSLIVRTTAHSTRSRRRCGSNGLRPVWDIARSTFRTNPTRAGPITFSNSGRSVRCLIP
jgi:hypothetical protein